MTKTLEQRVSSLEEKVGARYTWIDELITVPPHQRHNNKGEPYMCAGYSYTKRRRVRVA